MGGGPGYSSGYGHAPNSHHWHQDKDTSDHLDHISKGRMRIVRRGFSRALQVGSTRSKQSGRKIHFVRNLIFAPYKQIQFVRITKFLYVMPTQLSTGHGYLDTSIYHAVTRNSRPVSH
jgi:hypothetical protein